MAVYRNRGQAQAALARLTALLNGLGLEPKPEKTRIVQPDEGEPGFDFLRFNIDWCAQDHAEVLAGTSFWPAGPSQRAVRHARDRIASLRCEPGWWRRSNRSWAEVNLFLRGWAGFFRFGNSAWVFDKIRKYAVMRIALFAAKQHKRGRLWGFVQLYRSPDSLGVSLNGIVVAPRPNRPWRAPVEHRR